MSKWLTADILVMFFVARIARNIMVGVDIQELQKLKYDYKGA